MNAATKTIEQLTAEANAAAEALRAAEHEATEKRLQVQRAAERTKREEEQDRRNKKAAVIAKALQAALAAEGFDTVIGSANKSAIGSQAFPQVALKSKSQDYHFSLPYIEDAYSGSSSKIWGQRVTGFKIVVGSYYGGRKTFPQKKDGTFSYAKIAKECKSLLVQLTARVTREKVAKEYGAAADVLVKKLTSELKLNDYRGLNVDASYGFRSTNGNRWTSYVAKPGHVYISIGHVEATPEQVKAVFAALKAAGIVQRKS